MIKETKITIFKKANIWRFEIESGKYKVAGFGDTLQEAEDKAYFALTGIPNHGTIHSVYIDGKPVKPAVPKG